MNIFRLDDEPALAAKYHCDRHCVKMVLETAQLLSTAHHVLGSNIDPGLALAPTHLNHPCAVWVRGHAEAYRWAYKLLVNLALHYTARYGRIHKYEKNGLIDELQILPRGIGRGRLAAQPQCMPVEYRRTDNPVLAYRLYYLNAKRHLAAWHAPDGVPPWWTEIERLAHRAAPAAGAQMRRSA